MRGLKHSLCLGLLAFAACSSPSDQKKVSSFNVAQFQGLWVSEDEAATLRATRGISKKDCDAAGDAGKRSDTVLEINAAGEVFEFNPQNAPKPENKVATIQNGKVVATQKDAGDSDSTVQMVGSNLVLKFTAGNSTAEVKFTQVSREEATLYLAAQDECVKNAPPAAPRLTQLEVGTGTLSVVGGLNATFSLSAKEGYEVLCTQATVANDPAKAANTEFKMIRATQKMNNNTLGSGLYLQLPSDTNIDQSDTEIDRDANYSGSHYASITLPGKDMPAFVGGKCKVTLNRSRLILEVLVDCQGVQQIKDRASEPVEIKASIACDASIFRIGK